MSLSCGIVGLPNVGKSTLFNALTDKNVDAKNYPFCTIDPSVGIVEVPDDRLPLLSKLSKSAKTIPAVIEFVDIAGLVEGASKGEGLGNKFLSHIREVDAILQIVRLFPLTGKDDDITHVYGDIDPLRDIEIINMELIVSDMQSVEKRRASINRDVKRGIKEAIFEDEVLKKIQTTLEESKMVFTLDLNTEERKLMKSFSLLTAKKFIYGLNLKAGANNYHKTNEEGFKKLVEHIHHQGAGYVLLDARSEDDFRGLSKEEQEEFIEELGDAKGGIGTLITGCYELLGLQTFFTTGEDESRAWTIKIGAMAPEAGAAIHNDFKDRFIRAEVIYYKDLLDSGSYAIAREKGLLRLEGKDYIVTDGDVIEFKIA